MTEFLTAPGDPALLSAALLFFVGMAAGAINVMAGSGSALTLPALIFSGLDGSEANGTNRLAILIQNIAAGASFSRERAAGGFRESVKYSLFTLPGMVCGVLVAVSIDDLLFKKIAGGVILLVAASMFLPSLVSGEGGGRFARRKWLLYPALVATGFYGGFIQVGVGLVIMGLMFHLVGGGMAEVNARKVFIVLIYTAPAFVMFFFSGNVDLLKGFNLAAGSAIGGWWGAKLSVRKGAAAVRWFLVVALLLSGLKLFGVL
ncbi:MAG: sulfite exporter TauE/SafE family protein [Candidatus Dadabacteria bacterium]|nr:sulfite exporter TauE/SafE family protein [Candidatus Dadabacteria bacterium]MCY4043392.1 sulfite exporter TauE/SafE family protein [Candidatus Dadabacteria bacterium]MCY4047205.1 sulfite exporter TauE/SafE family protein [Candidatus Dadabacteria bacterium]